MLECGNCRFWHKNKTGGEDSSDDQGTCRRFPPVLSHVAHYDNYRKDVEDDWEPSEMHYWFQPITLRDDWCGEYKEAGE